MSVGVSVGVGVAVAITEAVTEAITEAVAVGHCITVGIHGGPGLIGKRAVLAIA